MMSPLSLMLPNSLHFPMKHMHSTLLRTALLGLVLAAAAGPAAAQSTSRPPGQISYQGYLTDANGIPLATNTPKNFSVQFRLYNSATASAAANLLWGEQQVVTVDRGYFTVMLGAGSPIAGVTNASDLTSQFDAPDASSRYLGMTVLGLVSPDFELTPRLRLTTSPYALLAANATALSGPAASANSMVVKNGLVVDGANQNNGALLTNTSLTFGAGGTEGITSQRTTPAAQQNDLALFTAGQPRLTILNNGKVAVGGTNSDVQMTVAGDFSANSNIGLQVQGAKGGGAMLDLVESGNWGWGIGLLPNLNRLGFFDNRYPGSAGTEVLTLARGGNLGINQTSPGFPLNFSSTLGDKISLFGASGNHYGFGVQGSQLQIHTDTSSADIVFGYGQSSSLTETMRIRGNGRVGIGTSAVYGTLGLGGDWTGNFGIGLEVTGRASGGSVISVSQTGTYSWGIGMPAGLGRLGFFAGRDAAGPGTEQVTIASYPQGYVGLGTTSPNSRLSVAGDAEITGAVAIGTTDKSQAKLSVIGRASAVNTTLNTGGFYYWAENSSRTGLLSGQAGAQPRTEIGIFCDQIIVGSQLFIFSDRRMKDIRGVSDSAADLNTLMGLEVTDYTYKDKPGRGAVPQKKVIAQQVEQVFPQAVSQSTDVLPDIYQKATVQDGWVSLATDLKVGERVRLIGEKEEGLYDVTEVRAGAFRTAFRPASDRVFVFGRQANDVRRVDYDAISMLNVSATQELAKRVAAQKAELEQLRSENESLAAKLSLIEARFARLEKGRSVAGKPTLPVSVERE